jgi:hypothetical protein
MQHFGAYTVGYSQLYFEINARNALQIDQWQNRCIMSTDYHTLRVAF